MTLDNERKTLNYLRRYSDELPWYGKLLYWNLRRRQMKRYRAHMKR